MHRISLLLPLLTWLALSLIAVSVLPIASFPFAEASVAETKVLSIDLGAQYVKTAAYTSMYSSPISFTTEEKMILNDQTNRKSPSCVALRYMPHRSPVADEKHHRGAMGEKENPPTPLSYTLERVFAEPADALLYRFPTQTVCHPFQYLFSSLSSSEGEKDMVSLSTRTRYQTLFTTSHPYRRTPVFLIPFVSSDDLSILASPSDTHRRKKGVITALASPHPQRSSPRAQHDGVGKEGAEEETFSAFTPEEILAMTIRESKRLAQQTDVSLHSLSEKRKEQFLQHREMRAYRHAWEAAHQTDGMDTSSPSGASLPIPQKDEKSTSLSRVVPPPPSPSAPIAKAVLAIPSGLSVAARQSLLDAATLAGCRQIRLVHSTTAAVYALFHSQGEGLMKVLKSAASFRRRQTMRQDTAMSSPTTGVPRKEEEEAHTPHEDAEEEGGGWERKKKNGTRGSGTTFPPDASSEMSFAADTDEVYVMIFEMGYQWAEAGVFALSTVSPAVQLAADALRTARGKGNSPLNNKKEKEDRTNAWGSEEDGDTLSSKGFPSLRLRRVASARSAALGAHALDSCIAAHWDAEYFSHRVLGPTTTPSSSRPAIEGQKDRLALLRAAEDARERLSVNKAVPVHIERLQPTSSSSSSFSTTLTREMFEKECADVLEAVVGVAKRAWAAVDALHTDRVPAQLERIDVVGAAARMPRLMQLLGSLPSSLPPHAAASSSSPSPSPARVLEGGPPVGIRQTLNADEAVVRGALSLATAGSATAASMPLWMPRGTSWVQDTLTNNIYLQASVPPEFSAFAYPTSEETEEEPHKTMPNNNSRSSGGGGAQPYRSPLQLVWEKDVTVVPSMYTVVLPAASLLSRSPFILSLYSPPPPPPSPEQEEQEGRKRRTTTTTEARSPVFAAEEVFPIHPDETERQWLSDALDRFYRLSSSSSSDGQWPLDTFARHYLLSDVHLLRYSIRNALRQEEVVNATLERHVQWEESAVRVAVEMRLREDGIPEVSRASMEVQWVVLEKVWVEATQTTTTARYRGIMGVKKEEKEENEKEKVEEVEGETKDRMSEGENATPHQKDVPIPAPNASTEEEEEAVVDRGEWRVRPPRFVNKTFFLAVAPLVPTPPPPLSHPSTSPVTNHSEEGSGVEGEKENRTQKQKSTRREEEGVPVASYVLPRLRNTSATVFTPESFDRMPLTSLLPPGANMATEEWRRSRVRLDAIERAEEWQHFHTHVRNALESVLVQIRSAGVWEKVQQRLAAASRPTEDEEGKGNEVASSSSSSSFSERDTSLRVWHEKVDALSEWIETDGEEAALPVLTRALENAKALQKEMQETIAALVS